MSGTADGGQRPTTNDIAVSLIAAVAANGIIGNGGRMPWRLSTDMRRFKALTMGKPVVMGRRTFESIGKPLAGRTNIVVSRRPEYRPEGVVVAASPEAALAMAQESARQGQLDEVFVIGGGELYAEALPLADRLYITHVDARPAGDARFPAIDPATWMPVSEERVPPGEKDSAPTTFTVYRRRDHASR